MVVEYALDPTSQVTAQVTAADTTLTVPVDSRLDTVNRPNDVGSLWWLSVVGNPVAINIGGAAVFATNFVIGVGTYLQSIPIRLPPGAVLHFICAATLTAQVSIIRARRAS